MRERLLFSGNISRKGFTLTEIMIAVTIIAIVIGSMIYNYQGLIDRSKPDRVRMDLETIANAIDRYTRDTGRPFHKVRKESPNPLSVLEGKYIDRIPLDPWGRPYQVDGTFVYSQGPIALDRNGKPYRADDIQRPYQRRAFIVNPSFESGGDGKSANGWITNLPGEKAEGFSGMGDQKIIQIDMNDADPEGHPNSIVIRP